MSSSIETSPLVLQSPTQTAIAVAVAVDVAAGVSVAVAKGVALSVGVAVAVSTAVGVGVADGLVVGVSEAVAVGVADAVSVGRRRGGIGRCRRWRRGRRLAVRRRRPFRQHHDVGSRSFAHAPRATDARADTELSTRLRRTSIVRPTRPLSTPWTRALERQGGRQPSGVGDGPSAPACRERGWPKQSGPIGNRTVCGPNVPALSTRSWNSSKKLYWIVPAVGSEAEVVHRARHQDDHRLDRPWHPSADPPPGSKRSE